MEIKNVNPDKLLDEFVGKGIIPVTVKHNRDYSEYIAKVTWVSFSEDTDMELVQKIIAAHDPTPLTKEPTEMERLRQENRLLKVQTQILADRADFHEDILTEVILTMLS